ncbi:hypothetical protein K492DRAFT_20207 [Lichtheimia hyalospora FSU 10163]|nr:hypothetical protein K492DRAFT_20207 [Lichtheimia hyalospora FSU 10163]
MIRHVIQTDRHAMIVTVLPYLLWWFIQVDGVGLNLIGDNGYVEDDDVACIGLMIIGGR